MVAIPPERTLHLAVTAAFLVFASFLLLLLVTLSAPFIKTIYVLRLAIFAGTSVLDASASALARFGVWGYCISSINVSVAGWQNAVTSQQCSKPRLGYNFGSSEQQALSQENFNTNVFSKAITAVMVLHPIACGVAFITLCSTLLLLRFRRTGVSRLTAWLVLGQGVFAAILLTAVFLNDIIFVAVSKRRVKSQTDGLVTCAPGNGVWMVLGATLAQVGALAATWAVLHEARSTHSKRTVY